VLDFLGLLRQKRDDTRITVEKCLRTCASPPFALAARYPRPFVSSPSSLSCAAFLLACRVEGERRSCYFAPEFLDKICRLSHKPACLITPPLPPFPFSASYAHVRGYVRVLRSSPKEGDDGHPLARTRIRRIRDLSLRWRDRALSEMADLSSQAGSANFSENVAFPPLPNSAERHASVTHQSRSTSNDDVR